MTTSGAVLVMPEPESHRCDGTWCWVPSAWRVEAPDRVAAPQTLAELDGTRPLSQPIRHACHNHLLGALTQVLAHPLATDRTETS